MKGSTWTGIIIVLFLIGMWAFPNRQGTIGGFPADYVVTFGVGFLFLVVMGIFGWQMVNKDEERGETQ